MIMFILLKIKNFKILLPVMVVMTCMTLVFIYIFGIGFSKGYIPKVGIVDEDGSQTSQMIVQSLMSNNKYNFLPMRFDEARNLVQKDDLAGFVHINKGFEEGLDNKVSNITFYRGASSVEILSLEQQLNTIVAGVFTDKNFINNLSAVLTEQSQSNDIATEEIYADLVNIKKEYVTYQNNSYFHNQGDGIQYDSLKNSFTGFLLFFSMFTIMFGIGTIVDEKEVRVWQRQLVSPLKKSTIIIGNLISNFILGMAQLLIIVLASRILFEMDWGGSIIALFGILAAYVVAGTAMGLFIAGYVKTQQQLSAALPTIIVSTSMIGGCMWPVELMPKFMRVIAQFLPQRWGMEGLSQVILYNGSIENVAKPMIILLIISGVFLAASIIPYSRNEI